MKVTIILENQFEKFYALSCKGTLKFKHSIENYLASRNLKKAFTLKV